MKTVFYTSEEKGSIRKQVYLSKFYEEGDFKVEIKWGAWLFGTGDEEVFYTSSDNLIYLEGEE